MVEISNNKLDQDNRFMVLAGTKVTKDINFQNVRKLQATVGATKAGLLLNVHRNTIYNIIKAGKVTTKMNLKINRTLPKRLNTIKQYAGVTFTTTIKTYNPDTHETKTETIHSRKGLDEAEVREIMAEQVDKIIDSGQKKGLKILNPKQAYKFTKKYHHSTTNIRELNFSKLRISHTRKRRK